MLQRCLRSNALISMKLCDEDKTLSRSEVEQFLEYLVGVVDYAAMSDFFLSYRPYMRPCDLLDFLVTTYQAGYASSSRHKVRQMRVRTFVALRHWMLNYYADDFLLSRDLQQRMSSFLNSLAGMGADEVSTEDRIAKELRRCWAREQDIHTSLCETRENAGNTMRSTLSIILESPYMAASFKTSTLPLSSPSAQAVQHTPRRHGAILRGNINASKDCRSNVFRPDTILSNDESPAQLPTHCEAAESGTSGISGKDQFQCQRTSCGISSVDENSHQGYSTSLSTKHTSYLPDSPTLKRSPSTTPEKSSLTVPIRTLKRKPGGDLRKAARLVDLQRPTRKSDESEFARPVTLSCPSSKFQALPDTLGPLQGQSIIGLFAQIFEHDDKETSEVDVSRALSQTLDILEGRQGELSGSEQISDDIFSSEVELVHKLPWDAMNPKKRKHEVAIVPEDSAEIHVDHYENVSPELSVPPMVLSGSSSVELRETSLETLSPIDSDDLVTIVEALEMPQRHSQDKDTDLTVNRTVSTEMWLLEQNAAVLSRGLTIIEKGLLLEIDWLELASGTWTHLAAQTIEFVSWKEAVGCTKSAVGLIIARFDCVVSWITTLILTSRDAQSRARLIGKFLDIALLCRAYNNFATTMQIYTSLYSPDIRRLQSTWKLVPKDSLKALRSLEGLCDEHNNWHTIRVMQERATINPSSVVLPFLGSYLAEMLTIDRDDGSIIARMRHTAQITKTILEMVDRITDEEPFEETLVNDLVWIEGYEGHTLTMRSKLCEP